MRKLFIFLGVIMSGSVSAEFYKVEVTRIDNNLYRTSDKVYIETKFCYEYANREDAVLSYEQYSYDNKLIFDNGNVCEVTKVFK
ncbi:hypothetical protein [Pelistega ratti]|uniref:hypothetical protein n=1 Tax=Pelistega ratti TaxID=2652177 RepID=UPI001358CF51|nr:hypothetical protein [Pelistega ratti]